ncbi:ABC transporter C family member 8-like [Panicum miliaceum]|uniref:ABC transporter C family member 8-like n=1 Tax=Panicum miliaceum TaxID=4540 RepID=A0A3L6T425_PANMI|nr:ABC transporter C family member 8-like [Panicum miliaceum]
MELCFQRSLVDLINLLLLAIYTLSLAVAACARRWARARDLPLLCYVTSPGCAVLGVACVCSGAWGSSSSSPRAALFVRGVVWIFVSASLFVRPTRFSRAVAMAWWAALAAMVTAYSVEKIVRGSPMELLDIASWVASSMLLLCTISVCRGGTAGGGGGEETQTLLTAGGGGLRKAAFGEAGFLSRLTFTWMDSLLRLGYSKPLDLSDMPPLDADDAAEAAQRTFLQEWHRRRQTDAARTSNQVFWVLANCYKKELLLTALYTLLRTLSFSASPVILYIFVAYSYQRDRRIAAGITLILGLVVMKVVESLSQRHWFFGSRRLGMRMRSALMAAVFDKQLRLSSEGRRRHGAGEVANYIAVDAYRLGEFLFWLHCAWCMPVQLALAIAMLFWTVGAGALPGLAPVAACGVLNVPLARMLQRYQSRFMQAQDERQRATAEVLNAMKVVKLQSWEDRFREAVQRLRDVEVRWLAETQIKKAYGSALYWMSPTIISAVIFAGTAALRSAPLDASVVFTILATLRVISEPMRVLPEVMSIMIQVKVSLDRIGEFLTEDEFQDDAVDRTGMAASNMSLTVQSGVFSWEPSEAVATLKDINVTATRGEKIAVCGPVGAGKSSLLCSMLGEIPKISGSVSVSGSVAYVSQTSWIQSGTVRDNVLFGKPMNNEEYEKAIRCCALDKDIENFPHGDLTEIGQRGLNMSGGQKQRIQLARAVYNNGDIYLLDDPFSAVDAHTAATLFNDCVMAALENKTVILVTHQVEFLSKVDKILVMENGEITQEGTYQELLQSGTAFEQLVNAHRDSKTPLDTQDHGKEAKRPGTFQYQMPMIPQNSEAEVSTGNLLSVQLTEEEKRELGETGLKPYKDYVSVSKSWFLLVLIILAQCAFVVLQCLATYWLAIAVQNHQFSVAVVVGVYAVMATASCLFAYIRSLLAAHFGLKASRKFFSGLMDSVFKAPMLFFDSTPIGRIMTRASSDLSVLDFDVPYTMTFVISGTIEVAATIVIMIMVTWQVVLVAVPVVIVLLYIQRYYIASARELVRINGTTKAPVMNFAAESMLGVITIRAFAATRRFIQTNLRLIDTDATLFFYTSAALEWVLLRVEALQILVIITSSVLLVSLPEGAVAPGFLGLCLSYALTLSSAQVFLTRFYSYLENYIISVERIKQFMHLPAEPPAVISDSRPPPSWPSEGRIDLQNLRVKYRPNAPTVLRGITCTFEAGNKIGVVGRTGSGKTTLLSALFRLVDPCGGRILIDDLDICTIGLKDLRMKLSIIPQEPTLFRGSVRSNVDPLVSDDGENWSAGQRQLFCLARVLLRRNKILVLDEATASIDSATDAILQRVIKQEFSGCTVMTIAHRVPTVTDSDMVMVLSYGKMIEYDRPSSLMENKESAFCKLVDEYWSNYN